LHGKRQRVGWTAESAACMCVNVNDTPLIFPFIRHPRSFPVLSLMRECVHSSPPFSSADSPSLSPTHQAALDPSPNPRGHVAHRSSHRIQPCHLPLLNQGVTKKAIAAKLGGDVPDARLCVRVRSAHSLAAHILVVFHSPHTARANLATAPPTSVVAYTCTEQW
jgi:hypothetical protein